MGSIGDPLTAAIAHGMIGHDLAGVAHDDTAGENHHLDGLPNEAPRHRVAVGVEVDRAVRLHLADQIAQLAERRSSAERTKRASLGSKARHRQFAGRAVQALVGNLAGPLIEVRLERCPTGEPPPGDGVALDVADPALILALGPRPIRRARFRREPPVVGKGMEPGVEPDLPGRRVMVLHQRPGVVEQNLRRHAAEPQERTLHPLEPVHLALAQRGSDMHPPRVAERGDEQMRADLLIGDPYLGFAKVDLQLPPRRRLEPNRRPAVGLQLPAPALHLQLNRAQADHDPVLAGQLLAYHVGVAAVAEEPLPQPLVQPVQHRFVRRLPKRRRPAVAKISSHRVAGAAELTRQSLGAPAKLMQPQHRSHLLRLKHLLSLHRPRPCRNP